MADQASVAMPPRVLVAARKIFSRYPPTQALAASSDPSGPTEDDDSKLRDHIIKYKQEAYAAYPYPCIKLWLFLHSTITDTPVYESVIKPKLQPPSSTILMDIGCGLGQDIRSLVSDGAEPENIIGFDLHQEFIQAGYGLFMDGPDSDAPLKSTFITGSLFDDDNDLTKYHGKVDIIHISSVLHLFGLEKQITVANRLDKVLKSEPGAIITGKQLGVKEPGVLKEDIDDSGGFGSRVLSVGVFRHNPETFKDFWTKVGDGKWNVQVTELVLNIDPEQYPITLVKRGDVVTVLRFAVTRL
ncbi:hypothetical protein TWF694_007996 [Orbilia ellipsospora]|uniref:Methyltransferase domain-containing protein n=1 Tax=Orbilia ellipsospora TaxID=2528407 RepID=A0AAV9XF75_9PEZI